MSEYLLINLGTVLVPLLLSFEKKLAYYKKFRYVALSILTVSPAYIVWDHIATVRGDWGFSPEYLLGFYLFDLPLEEVLFFITVPFSCLFIYETVSFYIRERQLNIYKYAYLIPGVFFIALAVIFRDQYYTSTVTAFSGIFLIAGEFLYPRLLRESNYWLFLLITYVPFLIVNYLLTFPPIVWYSDKAIWGPRFITIPWEDFFYSFSMISFWYLFYKIYQKKVKFGSL